jgi:endonuclease/exonuclease/phosphatase family metal-dependent hydrolase
MFLFFFQLITEFLESIYALNLIEVELNENVLALLFLLTPILLLFFKRGFPNKVFIAFGEVVVICRVLQPFLDVQLKMLVTGFGLACFMIFFPVYLHKKTKGNHESNGILLGAGLGLGLLLSILLRTLGSSIDLSAYSWFMWIGWILAIFAGLMIIHLANSDQSSTSSSDVTKSDFKPASKWKIIGLTLGMISVITLIYFVFSSPTVIARWTEGNYILILTLLVLVNSSFIILVISNPGIIGKMKSYIVTIWNVTFITTLTLTILGNTVIFAFVPSYPFYPPGANMFNEAMLMIMLVLSPIILLDFILLSSELFRSRPGMRKLGGSFFVSSGFFLIMILSAVFTIVWDYIPLIGDLFRDAIWVIFLILGVFVFLPLFLINKASRDTFESINSIVKNKKKAMIIIVMISLTTIIGAVILELPVDHNVSGGSLKVLSYNIQQGSDESGNKNFDAQYQVIEGLNADIIGLQESETCRISSGNSDIVRFVSNRLKLYSYYGPKTLTGTFGIALLSKYPIMNPKTFYMKSEGEQTATVWAQIYVGSTIFNIFLTHLGNYEDTAEDRSQIVQQENILSVTNGLSNVILMGDFNFELSTEQYNITVAQLYDCWEVAPAIGKTIGNVPEGWKTRLPDGRIDHIFVSGELNTSISFITYTGGTAADHPCVFMSLSGPF